MPEIYLNILENKRLEVLKQLKFVREFKMYLAGGTALALQLGHRTSVDFDFYTPQKFKSGKLLPYFLERLGNYNLRVIRDIDNTFELNINDVHLSCFYYPYKLVDEGKVIVSGVTIATIEDVAAMKLVAITQRGLRRDFVDMYYLLKKFGLQKILELTGKKYPEFDIYNGLRGLVYFHDADNDREVSRIEIFDKDFDWGKVKKFIERQVFDFQRKC